MILCIMNTDGENMMCKFDLVCYYFEETSRFITLLRNANISAGKEDMRKIPAAFFLYLDVYFPILIHWGVWESEEASCDTNHDWIYHISEISALCMYW